MKRMLVMLSINLLVASGFLFLQPAASGASGRYVQVFDRDVVRDAQRQLKAYGFNPGSVDGNFGAQTEAALRAYQHDYRLPETGQLDEATQRSLLPQRFEASRPVADVSNRQVLLDAQRQLKALGFDPGAADGNFGAQTKAALRAYQHAYRLPETGKLDDITQRSLLPQQFEASRPPVDFSNRQVVRQAQRQLKALGFDPGSVDGSFGAQTQAALRAYQHAYRLPETGRLDEATWRSLHPEQREGALR